MKRFVQIVVSVLLLLGSSAYGQQDASESLELLFARLSETIPGFAGYYVDPSDGTTVVNLADLAGLPAARALLGPGVKTRLVEFPFRQLTEWRHNATNVLALQDVVYLDLDEVQNRVVIGIAKDAATDEKRAIQRFVAALGIPSRAVSLIDAAPLYPISTLRDLVHPQPAGVEIGFVPEYGSPSSCTLGFNVAFEKGSGFVTASHCTSIQGVDDGYDVGLGTEESDPAYQHVGDYKSGHSCPDGFVCRGSDSALIYYRYVTEQGAGSVIARPVSRTLNVYDPVLTIDPVNPEFTIRSVQRAVVGQTVHKVGSATGWTKGHVTATCVDIRTNQLSRTGEPIALLCQHQTDVSTMGGDSGSPVFTWDGANGAGLLGIMVASNLQPTSPESYFSDVSHINYELGPLTGISCSSCP